jgi:hypothetical protein
MKKDEMITQILFQQEGWEETWHYFAKKGMQKSTKKELEKWLE